MTLVEERIRLFQIETVHILGDEKRLQVGRIVDRMRPRVAGEEREVVREAPLELDVHRIVARITVGKLSIDRTEGREGARRSQCSTCAKNGIEYRLGDLPARKRVCQEVVRSIRTEEVRDRRCDHAPAGRDGDHPGNGLSHDVGALGRVYGRNRLRRRRERTKATAVILDLECRVRSVQICRPRQMVSPHVQVRNAERHI